MAYYSLIPNASWLKTTHDPLDPGHKTEAEAYADGEIDRLFVDFDRTGWPTSLTDSLEAQVVEVANLIGSGRYLLLQEGGGSVANLNESRGAQLIAMGRGLAGDIIKAGLLADDVNDEEKDPRILSSRYVEIEPT